MSDHCVIRQIIKLLLQIRNQLQRMTICSYHINCLFYRSGVCDISLQMRHTSAHCSFGFGALAGKLDSSLPHYLLLWVLFLFSLWRTAEMVDWVEELVHHLNLVFEYFCLLESHYFSNSVILVPAFIGLNNSHFENVYNNWFKYTENMMFISYHRVACTWCLHVQCCVLHRKVDRFFQNKNNYRIGLVPLFYSFW